MTLFLHWALAFVLTQTIEIPIYLFAMRRRPRKKAFLVAFGASAFTHPIVAFVIPALWQLVLPRVEYVPGETVLGREVVIRAIAFFALAEGFAIIAEAVYLGAFRVARPLMWSILANAASSSIGLALTLLTGWP